VEHRRDSADQLALVRVTRVEPASRREVLVREVVGVAAEPADGHWRPPFDLAGVAVDPEEQRAHAWLVPALEHAASPRRLVRGAGCRVTHPGSHRLQPRPPAQPQPLAGTGTSARAEVRVARRPAFGLTRSRSPSSWRRAQQTAT